MQDKGYWYSMILSSTEQNYMTREILHSFFFQLGPNIKNSHPLRFFIKHCRTMKLGPLCINSLIKRLCVSYFYN